MLINIPKSESFDEDLERKPVIVIHPYDTWSMDYTLSMVMVHAFKEFKRLTNGHPGTLNSMQEWYAILDKIIEAHELIVQMNCDLDYAGNEKKKAKVKKGLALMSKYWRSFWW